jgi:hypothetical protein
MILLYALQVAVVITLAAAGIALAAARISQTQKNRRHGGARRRLRWSSVVVKQNRTETSAPSPPHASIP